MKITSKIDAVTLFVRGAEVTRLAEFVLCEGEHEIVLNDLPQSLVPSSLRVEGQADGELMLGDVDSRAVHIPADDKPLDDKGRRALERKIEKLEDEVLGIEGAMQTARTQQNLMDNLAAMPVGGKASVDHGTDWGAVFDLIGERLPIAHGKIVALTIERREVQEKIDDLRRQLADQPATPLARTQVSIKAKAATGLRGLLTLRYQMRQAGWQPLYDARLGTGDGEDNPVIDLVRRATIRQNSEEVWEDVALTLSTTRPTGGTGAPDLPSKIIDILPDNSPRPIGRAMSQNKAAAAPEGAAFDEALYDEPPQAEMMIEAQEMQSDPQQTGFQASFKVPGRVSLAGNGEHKKVRLGAQNLTPSLESRSTPLLEATAFLYAQFKLTGDLALLPGEVALYRDNIYVGNGRLPLVNVGERHELGFGADDKVSVKRVELKRSKGRHGLIKSENTDERHFKITVTNHHQRAMPVRIEDRIPASNHEKLRVDMLGDMSVPTQSDVDDKRGVLAFVNEIGAGNEQVIIIHYRISWPKDQRIG